MKKHVAESNSRALLLCGPYCKGRTTREPIRILLFILVQFALLLYTELYLVSDWPKAYSEFSKSAPVMSRTLEVTGDMSSVDGLVTVISLCLRLWLISPASTLTVFWIPQKPHLIIVLLYIERKKVLMFLLLQSNTKHANMT